MSELLKINVNEHTEKKNGLTYLSWAWAWAEVLKIDPQATWEAVEFNGAPCAFLPDSSALVKVLVTIKGNTKSCWLPVMNHRNQAIKGPDAFAINTAIVRCLTKCISMHGLGLYIYAGEDLPEDVPKDEAPVHVGNGKAFSEAHSPTKIAFESMTAEWKDYLTSEAPHVERAFAEKGAEAAAAYVRKLELDADAHAALFSLLGSKTRSGINSLTKGKA